MNRLHELRTDGFLEFEGARIEVVPGKETGSLLHVGDTYYAARNTEQLLTVKKVDLENRWVEPVERAYFFDLHDCVGVTVCL